MRTGPYTTVLAESGVEFRAAVCRSGPLSYSVADDDPDADWALSEGYTPSDGGCRGDAQLPAAGTGSWSSGRPGEAGSPGMLVGVWG